MRVGPDYSAFRLCHFVSPVLGPSAASKDPNGHEDDRHRSASFRFVSVRCGEENAVAPAGRDNPSILPLEWLSGKLKNLATGMPASNATTRFSDRVENYVRYRPGYPTEALQTLKAQCDLAPSNAIADVASGTGLWTRLLLENGNQVFGIEPNAEMRAAG